MKGRSPFGGPGRGDDRAQTRVPDLERRVRAQENTMASDIPIDPIAALAGALDVQAALEALAGAAGGTAWGDITGVLGDQADLVAALAAKQDADPQLASLAALAYAGNAGKFVRVNAGETDFELASVVPGGGSTFHGARVARTLSNFTIPAGVDTIIQWDTKQVDTDGFVNLAAHNTRITIPPGVTWVVCSGNFKMPVGSADMIIQLYKNGALTPGSFLADYAGTGGQDWLNATSSPISVVAGDYLEMACYSVTADAIGADANTSWFSIWAIENTL